MMIKINRFIKLAQTYFRSFAFPNLANLVVLLIFVVLYQRHLLPFDNFVSSYDFLVDRYGLIPLVSILIFLSFSHSVLLILIFNIPIFVLRVVAKPKTRSLDFMYGAAFALFLFYLFINYRFVQLLKSFLSFDMFVLVFQPGILRDIGFHFNDLFVLLLIFLGIALFQWGLLRIRILYAFPFIRETKVLVMSLVVILIGLITHSYFNHTSRLMTNLISRLNPFYFENRLDSGLMTSFWKLQGIQTDRGHLLHEKFDQPLREYPEYSSFLKAYPSFSSSFNKNSNKDWNIVFIVMESVRYDMLDPEIMPNLYRWGHQDALVSKRHFSTGNHTSAGLFGLFWGQVPFFWFPAKNNSLRSPFFSYLKKAGYQLSLYTSSNLNFQGMDRYIGPEKWDFNKNFVPKNPWVKYGLSRDLSYLAKVDREMVETYIQSLSREKRKDFDFLYFYSTHYNYVFPESFKKFKPILETGIILNGISPGLAEKFFNRYKNACFYVDHLIGEVITALKERELLDKTIIVVTSDHGEEFFEEDRYGHGTSLDDNSTQVPFIFYSPTKRKSRYEITSHSDVVPTVLDVLGVEFEGNQAFSGKSLFNYEKENEFALMVAGTTKSSQLEYRLAFPDQSYFLRNAKETVYFEGELSEAETQRAQSVVRRQKNLFRMRSRADLSRSQEGK